MTRPKNNMRRYHYSVFFPENTAEMLTEFFEQITDVSVTYHAAHQMFDDPKGIIDLPNKEDLLQSDNILVEFYENLDFFDEPTNKIQKILVRVKHFNNEKDFTYLLAREGYIISAWANDKNDIHRLTSQTMQYYYKPNYEYVE